MILHYIFRLGIAVLSLWSGFNLLLALGILFLINVLKQNAPAFSILFDESAMRRLNPKVIATVNALAVLCNGCIAGFCILLLAVIWMGLLKKMRWAFWALTSSMLFVQALGFLSDSFLGKRNFRLNMISTSVLVFGLVLCAVGIYWREKTPVPESETKPTAPIKEPAQNSNVVK